MSWYTIWLWVDTVETPTTISLSLYLSLSIHTYIYILLVAIINTYHMHLCICVTLYKHKLLLCLVLISYHLTAYVYVLLLHYMSTPTQQLSPPQRSRIRNSFPPSTATSSHPRQLHRTHIHPSTHTYNQTLGSRASTFFFFRIRPSDILMDISILLELCIRFLKIPPDSPTVDELLHTYEVSRGLGIRHDLGRWGSWPIIC